MMLMARILWNFECYRFTLFDIQVSRIVHVPRRTILFVMRNICKICDIYNIIRNGSRNAAPCSTPSGHCFHKILQNTMPKVHDRGNNIEDETRRSWHLYTSTNEWMRRGVGMNKYAVSEQHFEYLRNKIFKILIFLFVPFAMRRFLQTNFIGFQSIEPIAQRGWNAICKINWNVNNMLTICRKYAERNDWGE